MVLILIVKWELSGHGRGSPSPGSPCCFLPLWEIAIQPALAGSYLGKSQKSYPHTFKTVLCSPVSLSG